MPGAMDAPPRLFDSALRAARWRRTGPRDAFFLHAAAAESVRDRLDMINRTFPRVLAFGHAAPLWAEILAGHPRLGEILPRPEGETLAGAPGEADLVLHALWLHWADDPLGVLVQSRLLLRPDGLMLAALLGGDTLAELRSALARAETEVTGGLSPRVAPMAALQENAGLLARAGFAMPVADREVLAVTHASALHLMRELRAMGETAVLRARLRRPTRRGVLLRAAALHAEASRLPGGRVRSTFEIHMLSGWAPGPGQPVPLRPGSATRRLAEALGTTERSAGEKAGG